VTVLAYAKLNLSLRVRARRPDGFHRIDSIIQTIDLADRITVITTGDRLRVESPFPPEEDLVYRAAQLVLAEKKAKRGVAIRVEKKIPAGAGLGGGSSDGAAVLGVLDRLIPPRLSTGVLPHLASVLGADVPLFLTGGRVRIGGKGDEVSALPLGRERAFLLLLPPIHCDTAAVYRAYDELHLGEGSSLPLQLGENDLEPAALRLYPGLIPYRKAIESVGGEYCGISGSGSTFYAAFRELEEAQAAGQKLALALPEARVILCTPTPTGRKEEKS